LPIPITLAIGFYNSLHYRANRDDGIAVIIRNNQQVFADTAYFLLNQLISLTCQIFADTAYFAESADFC